MSAYRCSVISGSGSATGNMDAMLNAWAAEQGITLEPGTFNLCADRWVMIVPGQRCDRLDPKGSLGPRNQTSKYGYAPRLYPVTLNGSVRAWLFRWSDPKYLSSFCNPDPAVCPKADRYCEIVAKVNLRAALGVTDGDEVSLDLAIA